MTNQIKFTPDTIFAFQGSKRASSVDYRLLEHSLEVTDSRGDPETNRPIQAFAFLKLIEELITAQSLNFTTEPVWIHQKTARRVLNKDEKELYNAGNTPVGKWLFDNMITRIHLPHAEDKSKEEQGSNAAIAMAYKDKGIEVAFGLNEKICENMQILGHGEILRTYGKNGIGLDMVETCINSWLTGFEDVRHVEMEKMERMKNCTAGGTAIVDTVIGKLYRAAINQSYGDKAPAPLDTYGVSSFTQQIMNSSTELKSNPSVWDIYNWGTITMKPDVADLRNIIETSALLAEFLMEEFNLN